MTCVVGLIEDGKVWLGGDSATTWQDDTARLMTASNPKVFRVGPVVIGISGSGRVCRLLQYNLTPPPVRGLPLDKYISTVFVDAMRKCLLEGGALKKENNVETSPSPSILVGCRGRIWRVDEDFNVDESRHPYDAVGCSASVALGSLYATPKMPARARIMTALRAAQEHNWSVRAPFLILTPCGAK